MAKDSKGTDRDLDTVGLGFVLFWDQVADLESDVCLVFGEDAAQRNDDLWGLSSMAGKLCWVENDHVDVGLENFVFSLSHVANLLVIDISLDMDLEPRILANDPGGG